MSLPHCRQLLALLLTLVACQNAPSAGQDAGRDVDAAIADVTTDVTIDATTDGDAATDADASLPTLGKTFPLSGKWTMRIRRRGPNGWSAQSTPQTVDVPGFYRPAVDETVTATELELSRTLPALASWHSLLHDGEHQLLLELDGVDYEAELMLVDAAGQKTPLGGHVGLFGRFFVRLPADALAGDKELVVIVRDVHDYKLDFDQLVATPAFSLQWGEDRSALNRMGIVEPCRLRLVSKATLKNGYVATLRPGQNPTLFYAAEIVALEKNTTVDALAYQIVDPREPKRILASGQFALNEPFDENGKLEIVRQATVSGLPFDAQRPRTLQATLRLLAAGRVIDERHVYFFNRRFATENARLLENGKRAFLAGAGLHLGFHIASFGTAAVHHELKRGLYVANNAALATRYQTLVQSIRQTGARLVRPAHLLPPAAFFREARAQQLLVYQDFGLTFKTDYARLPEREIERQLDEFLWTVCRYPALTILALHNEAAPAGPTPALLSRLVARAKKRAPHLVIVANSGGLGTAVFPPPPANTQQQLDDHSADFHAYLGHYWQPTVGHHNLLDKLEEIAELARPSAGKVIGWSELSSGWPEHYALLLQLPDSGNVLARVPFTVPLGSSSLSLAQFYALLYCKHVLAAKDLLGCATTLTKTALNDDRLVQFAKRFYFANRHHVLEKNSASSREIAWRFSADWLVTQLFESRLAYLQGKRWAYITPWEQRTTAFQSICAASPPM
jgi:hypothetical protein